MNVKIAPSLLAADLTCLKEEIDRAEEGGCDAFHVDIMDGHFVPNLSFGPSMVETLRRLTNLPIDVHLMVDNPLAMINQFADAGSDYITVHIETLKDIPAAFDAIRKQGAHPGITFRPDTPAEMVTELLNQADLVLVMSVYPGFGGQKFIETSYKSIKLISDAASQYNRPLIISVDGGVGIENAGKLIEAGANYLVAGTAIFKNHSAHKNIRLLRNVIDKQE